MVMSRTIANIGCVAATLAASIIGVQTTADASTPCPKDARACVDLGTGHAWLQRDGKTSFGPVPASGGAQQTLTPKGRMNVTRKVKNEWSKPFNAPMPNAVYFGKNKTDNGIAFHNDIVGNPSNGCVHLNLGDSEVFYNALKPGDVVFVF